MDYKTFEMLEAKYGKLIRADWHQHPTGGGWIYKDAKVYKKVNIPLCVVVWGGTILGGTILGGMILGGTIRGGTIRGGTISGGTISGGTISGGIILGGTISGGTISGGMILGGTILGGMILGGTISGGTISGGTISGGIILGGVWKHAPLFVSDSRGHGASNAKPGYLYIGCERHTFDEWKKRFPAIARRHNLTDEEKVEYKAIIDLFIKIGV